MLLKIRQNAVVTRLLPTSDAVPSIAMRATLMIMTIVEVPGISASTFEAGARHERIHDTQPTEKTLRCHNCKTASRIDGMQKIVKKHRNSAVPQAKPQLQPHTYSTHTKKLKKFQATFTEKTLDMSEKPRTRSQSRAATAAEAKVPKKQRSGSDGTVSGFILACSSSCGCARVHDGVSQ